MVLVRAVMPMRGVGHGRLPTRSARRGPQPEPNPAQYDNVPVIAITLLAIDLPVPEGGTVQLFWESVRHDGGHYAAFLISFFAIAAAWRDHHDIFKYVRRVDSGCGRTTHSGC